MAAPTEADILARLRSVYDVEIGVNIVDLGLVYGVSVNGEEIDVTMTLTSAACPLAAELAREIEEVIRLSYESVRRVRVAVVWEPPWSPARMSGEARRQLGLAK